MSEYKKLPEGITVRVCLYLYSEVQDIEVMASATWRGAARDIAALPGNWREAAAHLGVDVSPLDRLASDWRVMTRKEAADYDRRKEEGEDDER